MRFKRQYVVIFNSGTTEVVLAPDEYKAVEEAAEVSGYSKDQVKRILLVTPPSTLGSSLLTGLLLALAAIGVVFGVAALLGHWYPVSMSIVIILTVGFILGIQLIDDIMAKRKVRDEQHVT